MLTKLKNFSIGYNQLYGNLTTSFGNITSLELFNIENNVNITGYNVLDSILKNKTMLQHINIDSTQLSGTIPYNLTRYIPSLRTFTMDDTLITGPMPNLNSLQQLRRLIIVNDDMYGPIPELRLLTNLGTLVYNWDRNFVHSLLLSMTNTCTFFFLFRNVKTKKPKQNKK